MKSKHTDFLKDLYELKNKYKEHSKFLDWYSEDFVNYYGDKGSNEDVHVPAYLEVDVLGYSFRLHASWVCPICNQYNEYIGIEQDLGIDLRGDYDECKQCHLEVELKNNIDPRE